MKTQVHEIVDQNGWMIPLEWVDNCPGFSDISVHGMESKIETT